MLVMRTTKDPTYPICKLVSAKHSLGLDHFALAVYPFGFYGVQPRTPGGQEAGNYAYSTAVFFDLAVVGGDPALSPLGFYASLRCPRSESEPSCLSSGACGNTTRKTVWGYGAQRPTIHESQPRLFKLRQIKPLAGEGFGSFAGIVLCGLLLEDAHRLARLLPAMHRGSLKAAEPTSRPRNPKPTPDGPRRAGSADLDYLFSLVVGIRTFYPAFRPLPTHFKAYQSGSDGLCAYLPVG